MAQYESDSSIFVEQAPITGTGSLPRPSVADVFLCGIKDRPSDEQLLLLSDPYKRSIQPGKVPVVRRVT